MLNDMPCGKEKAIDYEDPVLAAIEMKTAIINGKLFGFVKCKLATPKILWTKFEEMPPIFVNREVLETAVPKEMLDYVTRTGRNVLLVRSCWAPSRLTKSCSIRHCYDGTLSMA